MDTVDDFVFYDTVQYCKRDWRNRNYFQGTKGERLRFSIPVLAKGRPLIKEVMMHEVTHHMKKLKRFFTACYGKAPNFPRFKEAIFPLLHDKWSSLSRFNISHTLAMAKLLGITLPRIWLSSEIDITSSCPTSNLIKICEKLGGTDYYNGPKGKQYIKEYLFNTVHLHYFHYPHEKDPLSAVHAICYGYEL